MGWSEQFLHKHICKTHISLNGDDQYYIDYKNTNILTCQFWLHIQARLQVWPDITILISVYRYAKPFDLEVGYVFWYRTDFCAISPRDTQPMCTWKLTQFTSFIGGGRADDVFFFFPSARLHWKSTRQCRRRRRRTFTFSGLHWIEPEISESQENPTTTLQAQFA